MTEETNAQAGAQTNEQTDKQKEVNLSSFEFDAAFLEGKGLSADAKVSEEKFEALKKEFLDLKNKEKGGEGKSDTPAAENTANGDNAPQQDGNQNPAKDDNMEEVQLSPNKDMVIDGDRSWIDDYEKIMQDYAAKNNKEWKRDDENTEGLKGNIGEAEYHFTAEDKVSVNAAGIEGLVNLAKETDQGINYNEKWSEEFKAKMFEACERMGVEILGRPEEQAQQTQTNAAQAEEHQVDAVQQGVAPDMAMQHVEGKGVYTLKDCVAKVRLKKALLSPDETKNEIEKLKKEGAALGNPDEKSAKLALCEYALVMDGKDADKKQDLANVLKKYGVESVQRTPDKAEGEIEVKSKDYGDYSDAEKDKINASIEKLQPKQQQTQGDNTNATVNAAVTAARNAAAQHS